MNKTEAIAEVERIWTENIPGLAEMRRRVRAEAEARIEAETQRRRELAARAIHYALDRGASKTALRKITTSDHWGFAGYVDLGMEMAER